MSSVSLWDNVNVRNYSFEERACCNVGESRVAGTVTLSEVREQVCAEGVEGSFPAGLVVGGAVGAVLLIGIAGIVICKRKRNNASTTQETASGGDVLTGNAKYEACKNDQKDLFPVAASPSAPKLPAPIPFSGRV